MRNALHRAVWRSPCEAAHKNREHDMQACRLISTLAALLTLLAACHAIAAGNPANSLPPPTETEAARALLKLTPPAHYCPLDPRLDADYLALASMSYARTGSDLLVLWRDCKTLSISRTGLEDYSKPSIAITAKVKDGHIIHLNMKQAEFLAALEREIAAGTAAAGGNAGNRLLGVVGRDTNAVYLGVLATQRVNGKDTVLATVLAGTLLKGLFLEVSVFQNFDGDMALSGETSYTKQIIRQLFADNAAPAASPN
jgi:hypothetical protein